MGSSTVATDLLWEWTRFQLIYLLRSLEVLEHWLRLPLATHLHSLKQVKQLEVCLEICRRRSKQVIVLAAETLNGALLLLQFKTEEAECSLTAR